MGRQMHTTWMVPLEVSIWKLGQALMWLQSVVLWPASLRGERHLNFSIKKSQVIPHINIMFCFAELCFI